MRLLLGFGNKARHGKDGCAASMIDHLAVRATLAKRYGSVSRPPEVLKLGFADALRRESSAAIAVAAGIERLLENGFRDDVSGSWVDIPAWVTADPNPEMGLPFLPFGKHAKLLQWWGTDYRRNQRPNYWTDQVEQQIVGFEGLVLVTDCRFLNEVALIKKLGGYTVNVTRLNENGTLFADPSRPATHISEIALDDYNWDFFIKVKNGDQALKSEYAITLLEHLLALKGNN
jgi:hypothetical protein